MSIIGSSVARRVPSTRSCERSCRQPSLARPSNRCPGCDLPLLAPEATYVSVPRDSCAIAQCVWAVSRSLRLGSCVSARSETGQHQPLKRRRTVALHRYGLDITMRIRLFGVVEGLAEVPAVRGLSPPGRHSSFGGIDRALSDVTAESAPTTTLIPHGGPAGYRLQAEQAAELPLDARPPPMTNMFSCAPPAQIEPLGCPMENLVGESQLQRARGGAGWILQRAATLSHARSAGAGQRQDWLSGRRSLLGRMQSPWVVRCAVVEDQLGDSHEIRDRDLAEYHLVVGPWGSWSLCASALRGRPSSN